MYLNVQRAALRLGVAPHTVRRWSASGLLPCTRTPGGHRRFSQDDVDALALQLGGSSQAAARRARERELDTLLETSLALVGRLETTELLSEIAARLTRLMDCTFCGISAFDEQTRTVSMLADYDDTGRRLPDMAPYRLDRFPLTRRVLEEQVTAVVNAGDPAADPDELRELVREGDKSLLLVPLVHAGRSIGLLELIDKTRERRYSRQELRICGAVAGQAAVALRNAQSFEAARRATRDVDRLCAQLGTARYGLEPVARAADPGEVLAAAARAACSVLGAASCVAVAGSLSAGAAGASADPPAEMEPPTAAAPGGTVRLLVATGGAGGLRLTAAVAGPPSAGEQRLLDLVATVAAGHLRRVEAPDES